MKKRRGKRAAKVRDEPEICLSDIVDAETVCAVCSAEFLDEEDLKLHIMQVHLHESNGKTICRFCYSVFCSADEFVAHFVHKHLCNIKFCFYCYRAFADSNEEHESKHHVVAGDRSVTCSQCSKIFTNKQQLQTHEYEEHRENEGIMLNGVFSLLSNALKMPIKKFMKSLSKNLPFKCAFCTHSDYNLNNYVEHLKTCSGCSFSCDKCTKVFKRKSGIVWHMTRSWRCQHFFIEQEQCLKCDEYFNTANLSIHIETCTAVKCPTCNVVFMSMNDLTEHQSKEHSAAVSLVICKFCKREFVGTLNLKKHIRRSHKDHHLYKYRCTHCNNIFMHPSKLFAHYFTQHKELQPYTCKICNKMFRLRKQFTIHIKLVHKSVGFVEFDKNLHVFFSDKRSEKPFEPTSEALSTDVSGDESNESNSEEPQKSIEKINKSNDGKSQNDQEESDKTSTPTITPSTEKSKVIEVSTEETEETSQSYTISDTTEKSQDSEEVNLKLKTNLHKTKNKMRVSGFKKGVQESFTTKTHRKRKARTIKRTPPKRLKRAVKGSKKTPNDSSDDEPLSNVRDTIMNDSVQPAMSLKARLRLRNKKAKLTCKICNKYCYTVQNYHNHMSLHENTKLKCIKCHEQFKSIDELKNHIDQAHSTSKLTETLKSLLEKRKQNQPKDISVDNSTTRPGDSIKSLVEQRKQSILRSTQTAVNKFQLTIKKVPVNDDSTATITAMTDHGISVKNFIENFRPDIADSISISNSVTIKTIDTPADKRQLIRMHKFDPEVSITPGTLRLPVKFKAQPEDTKTNVKVTLVQQLVTKPKLLNMCMDERIPVMTPPPVPEKNNEYSNTYADETDYTQYRNDSIIPDVAHEVMLGDADDVPNTKRLAQEIIIPNIPEKYGGVRIAHLQQDAPFYKIVKVAKLLKAANPSEAEEEPAAEKSIELPDGTQLVTVKNPFSHLIPNDRLEELLKANKNQYYTPKTKNIKTAIAKALKTKPKPRIRKSVKRGRKKKTEEDRDVEVIVEQNETELSEIS